MGLAHEALFFSSDASSVQTKPSPDRWDELFGIPVPYRLPSLVAQAVAWHEQMMVKGDVSPAARRDLKVAAGEARQARRLRAERDGVFGESTKRSSSSGKLDHKMMPPASSQLSIGTKLVKSYRGITHVVEVTPNGMLHQGTTYRSLSAVAKAITGTHWNGLLFFGLRQRKVYPKKLADHG